MAERDDARVELYGDFACPFSFMAERVVERLEGAGIAVVHRAFELWPPGIASPPPWPDDAEAVAARWGVELRRPVRPVRTRKAHEAVRQALVSGAEDALRGAIYRAHFADGRDIGRIDELARLAAEVGLDATEMRVVLDVDRWTGQVEAEEAGARRLGIGATPAFVVRTGAGPRVLLGLDEPDAMAARIAQAMEETRTG